MKVTKNSPPPAPPPTYTLELSEEEARFVKKLFGITCGVGKFADIAREIYGALDDARVVESRGVSFQFPTMMVMDV